jgi:hypothetical protein
MDYAKYLAEAGTAVRELCVGNLEKYADEAKGDIQDFLQDSKPMIEKWTAALAAGELKQEEFATLMKGRLDVAKMAALKQIGVAKDDLVTFKVELVKKLVKLALSFI